MACGYANSVILLGFLKGHKPRGHGLDRLGTGPKSQQPGNVPGFAQGELRAQPLHAYNGWRLERMNSRRTVTLGP